MMLGIELVSDKEARTPTVHAVLERMAPDGSIAPR